MNFQQKQLKQLFSNSKEIEDTKLSQLIISLKNFLGYEQTISGREFLNEQITKECIIPLAFTEYEESEGTIVIEADFDIVNLRLSRRAKGNNDLIYEYHEFYENIVEAIAEISEYDFEDLLMLDVGLDWLIKKLID